MLFSISADIENRLCDCGNAGQTRFNILAYITCWTYKPNPWQVNGI